MIEEVNLSKIVRMCSHLKYSFGVVYAADNFPLSVENNRFMIVNSDIAASRGKRWLLMCKRNGDYLFRDPLGLPIHRYMDICDRISVADFGNKERTNKSFYKLNHHRTVDFIASILRSTFPAAFNLKFVPSENKRTRGS